MSGINRIDKTVLSLNDAIMAINVENIERNPKVHIGINPLLVAMRSELFHLHCKSIEARREKMRKYLIEDFLRQDKELRQVGLAYINTIN